MECIQKAIVVSVEHLRVINRIIINIPDNVRGETYTIYALFLSTEIRMYMQQIIYILRF